MSDTRLGSELEDLNAACGITGQLSFREKPGVQRIVAGISNESGEAVVSLEGGQVLSWAPRQHQPVVWLSPYADFVPGRAVRGGIPVCWPWFGAHPDQPTWPSHGFARISRWNVADSRSLGKHGTQITLTMIPDADADKLWSAPARLDLQITVGSELELVLTTTNTGDRSFQFSEALHTYFNVADVRHVEVRGLDGCHYIDKRDGGRRKRQAGPVTVIGELDRNYIDSPDECRIVDPGLQRCIRIATQGSRSTVVWNPGHEKGRKMSDMGPEAYLQMLCVETANAADNLVHIEPGEAHRTTVRFEVEPL